MRKITLRPHVALAVTGLRAGVLFAFALLLLAGGALLPARAIAGPCDPPHNEIVCENSKIGNPPSEWDVSGAGDSSIQGFATDISVDRGEAVHFKVKTASTKYRLDIYRMGYYGGDGARKVATVKPSASLPQSQPACDEEASTGLVDCGSWAVSASWAVPSSAVSGIYFAKLVREDKSSEGSHIIFVVRNDESESAVLFQTSDTTWEAYNRYGGNSLYTGGPATEPDRAYKVSYNRPLTTRGTTPEDAPFNAEYPMVRWLERNGYDVSYFTGVDADRRGSEILQHKVYLSLGHDEYWSGAQRANVEAARDAGVSLAFFSGNEVFWKTRWEDSIDGSNVDHRTLVCYKETHANEPIDPEEPNVWTGTWRDPRFSPPADGGRPENGLTGTIFMVDAGTTSIEVPASDADLRIWRNTSVASLKPGETATLGEGTLGYEWDEDLDNGARPPGLIDLSSTTADVPQKLLDYGSTYGSGSATHHLTLYRAPSGALVFGAGTVQWSWGLEEEHDRGETTPDPIVRQATVNLLADMGAQPSTLQPGLAAAAKTTDVSPPTSTISTPIEGAGISSGTPVTIAGTANDTAGEGGGAGAVGGVEVSVDGGETWHPASGTDSWSYSWTPTELGPTTLMSRAVDDSGNIESPTDSVTVDVVQRSCPCSIWDESISASQDGDSNAIEVGVKFRSEVSGVVTGIRFYKDPANVGTHVGRLWAANGTELGAATFTGESGSGWQEASFATPIAIEPDTTYVAAYHMPSGHYASLESYFALAGVDNPPLHALAEGVDGSNGIYKYGAAGELFAGGGPDTFNSENYLVDVVFDDESGPDTTPPTVNSHVPVGGATEVATEASTSASFSEAMDPTTIDGSTVELRTPADAPVPASVSYVAGQRKAVLEPDEPLHYSTTYTAVVKGGSEGVADLAGNHLAGESTWTFTTVEPPPPPPDEGPGGPVLVIANSGNPFSRYYTEILRAEGMNEFLTTDISKVTPAVLAAHDVAILGEGELSAAEAQMLEEWVQGGGNLIAMRPDAKLAGLLGLSEAEGALANGYIKVNTGSSPGAGIVGQTIQFHGSADRYTAEGAQTVATLYSDASTPTASPAVTLHNVGSNGGHAAAFTYDLAKSIVYTRQGNPAWAGQERDGVSPVRSDDMFFGGKSGDVQPDWVNLSKVAIPQADEQQRLLTNLIGKMNLSRKPLPRFWFLPRGEKAAVVMTGDDHGAGGTAGRFETFEADSPSGCVVDEWQCVRGTSYTFPDTPLTDAQAAAFVAKGFDIGLHTSTNCANWTDRAELESFYSEQLEAFATHFPSLPPPATNRMHCIVWSDWATQPKVELENGIRLDTTYYYWPEAWVQDRPGLFTGSGMPMRFADADGTMLDVYQAATQMTDESGQTYPFTVDEMLDHALGPDGYYGVFTANMHTDEGPSSGADAVVAAAQERDVPVVSARQMLTWLDGRNQSTFDSVKWEGDALSFTISPGTGATGLRAMVPVDAAVGPLQTVYRNGTPVATTDETIKGVEYAFFDAEAGSYSAAYVDEAAPVISDLNVAAANDGTATVEWHTNEPADSRIDYGTDPEALSSNATDSLFVTSHSIQLSGLDSDATYYFRASSADGEANSSTEPDPLLTPDSFTTPPAAPVLGATVPASPANANAPKLLGTAAAGATVRIYSGADCTGSPLVTDTAAALEAGIVVSVGDDSTTTFRATATSGAGSSTCSAPLAYVEDSSAPDTVIAIHPQSPSNSDEAEFEFSGSDSGSGVASYECRRDGGPWDPCASPLKYGSLAEGAHSFEVRALDTAGNADGSPAEFGWTVDTEAPDTAITLHPQSLSDSDEASFEFGGSDSGGSGVASFQCRKDGGSWSGCASPQTYSSLAEGAHSFEVRALDTAGNADGSPAQFGWTVDTIAPQPQVDSLSKTLLKAGESSELEWHADENGSFGLRAGGADCESGAVIDSAPYSGAPAPHTSEVKASDLAEGANTLRLCVSDAAGNRGQVTATIDKDTEAPDTAIALHPQSLSNSDEAEFTFTGSDPGGSGVASFECRRDSGSWSGCASPQTYSSLAEGAHSFEVRALDTAGNADGSPAQFGWTVDTVAPDTAIATHPQSLSNSDEASFEFTGSDSGGSGVASFQCRKDGGSWSGCASPQTYSSLAEGAHSFEVRALDTAGNADGSPAQFGWTVDTVAPDTAIATHPQSLSNSDEASFEFTGSDSGGSGVASFECRKDGGSWSGCASPQTYDSLAQGAHEFEVRAIDKAGNVDSAPSSFAWSVDSIAPDTAISAHPASLVNSDEAKFEFGGSDPGGSGVAGFECRRDSSDPEDWQPCTSPLKYSSLAEGAHSFEVRALDTAGNADGSPAQFGWTVDTVAPDTAIATHPQSLSNSDEASFEFTGSDSGGSGVASFECRRDGGSWTGCASPQTYSSLAEGAHSFEVRALDTAGNADGSPAEFGWMVDTEAPDTAITLHPQSLSDSDEASFEFGGSDSGGSGVASFQCRKDGGSWSGCASPQTYSSLAEGAHSFEVRALDTAGNADGSPAQFGWTVDTIAPQPQVDSLSKTLLKAGESSELEWHADENGSFGLRAGGADCESGAVIDSAPYSGAPAPHTSEVKASDLAEGANTLRLCVSDAAGNRGQVTATIDKDTEAPDTAIALHPQSLSDSDEASFEFSGSDPGGSGVASFECRRDGGSWTGCASPQTYSSLAEGAHSFEVRAVDTAGNADGAPAEFGWTVDTVAPDTAITLHPQSLSDSDEASFEFSGSDPGGSGVASFECRRDGGSWTGCSSPQTYGSLTQGAHSFEVRAVDTAGNADGSPAQFGWTVDTEAPDTAIATHPQSLSNSDEASFEFTGSDPGGSGVASFQCRKDGGSWSGCASPQTYSSLAEGTHSFEVRAVDTAGNVDGAPAEFGWSVDSIAPDSTISAHPASLVNSDEAKFEFTGSDPGGSGVAGFECRRDGGSWTSCASSQEYSSLGDGAHSFEVRAVDTAGNVDGTPAEFGWTVDTVAPQVQVDAAPDPVSSTADASFEFTGSDPGGSGVASIECRRDAEAWATCGSPRFYSSLAEGVHSFELRATDNAGNVGELPAPYEWRIDTQPPDTQITLHPQSLADSDEASFEFTGSDSGGSGVASFECRKDGGSWSGCASPQTYSSLAEGAHSFEVRALDTAGNADGSPAQFGWTVDTIAPQPQVDSLSKTLLKAGESSELEWHADENGSFGLRAGGADCESGAVIDSAPYSGAPAPHTSEVKASDLAEGANTLRLCVSDAAGNRGQATATIDKDTEAPDTAIALHPQSLSNSDEAEFTFTGSDPGGSGVASYECRKDGGSWSGCTSPQTYSSLAEGAHSFEVRALDTAGNADGSPAQFGWTVDTTPPAVGIDSGPAGLTNDATPTFAFHAGEAGAAVECSIDTGTPDFGPCTEEGSETPEGPLSDGPHTFRVRSTDAAGNQATATRDFTLDATSPETTLGAHPQALAASDEADFTFSGSDPGGSGVASFQCRKDGGSWSGCASPQTYSSLAEGAHSFEVRAVDNAGNLDGAPAEFGWTVDTEAPDTAITLHPQSLSDSDEASFEFSGSDPGGSGVASYECRRDGGSWSGCTSPQTYSSLAEGTHSFEVRALDTAGNADGSPAQFGWTVDTTPPAVGIDSGPAGLTNDATPTFAFHAGEAGAAVECSIDTGTPDFGPCTEEGSETPEGPLSDGPHTFRVRSTDAAGNQATATRDFEVDTSLPQAPELTATDPASPANDNQPKIEGSAPAGTTVKLFASIDCSGSPIATATPAELEAGIEVSVPDDSSTSFSATATSAADNASGCSEPISYVEDSSAPDTQLTLHPQSLADSDEASFEFSGSDPGGSGVASFECRRDGGSWTGCTSPQTYTSLAEGAHSFEVRAVDTAGNADGSPAEFGWSVDTIAPQPQVDSLSKTLLKAGESSELEWHADENGSFGLRAGGADCDSGAVIDSAPYSGAPAPHTSEVKASDLAEGANTLRLCVSDAAGNRGQATATIDKDTEAPDTAIALHPQSLSNSDEAEFTFTGSDPGGSGVASFECRRDSGSWTGCASPQTYSSLSEGAHSFEVRALDTAGNADGSPAQFGWTVDTVAPATAIATHPQSLSNSDEASFEFTGSDSGGSGVASFECRRDGGSWTGCSSPQTYGSLTQGAHSFEVRAVDTAGNADGSPAQFGWTVDTEAPDTAIATHPQSLSNSDEASFEFTGSDSGGSGVASFECRKDGGSWSGCASPQTYSSLAEGAHSFEVRAVDTAGNADGSPAQFGWTVDTEAPHTSISSHPAAVSASADASFGFSADDGSGSGVASFECRRDSAEPGDWESCGSPKTYKALAEGTHSFEVRAIDKAGNVAESSVSFGWTIDTKAPDTQMTLHPPSLSGSDEASFEFTGSDPGGSGVASFQCRKDGGSWSGCASPQTYSSLAEGAHSFEVRAVDNAGNLDGAPAEFGWTVDTEAPDTAITLHPQSLSDSDEASFEFSGSDPGGSGVASYECRKDGGSWSGCTSPQTYSSLAEGAHSFEVRALDTAGNADGSPAQFGWTVDTTPPAVGIDSGPAGLTNDATPTFAFHAGEAGAAVECSIDTGTPDFGPCTEEGSETPEGPLSDGPHTFRVRSIDPAGNQATATRDFEVDTSLPQAPELTATDPASPANDNQPKIEGSAPAGTTVKLFASIDCSGSPIATATPAELEAGIEVSVPDDSSTSFSATATSAADNASGCSEPISYVEDSSAPDTQLTLHPQSLSNSDEAEFTFTGSDPGGSGVASFECRRDSGSWTGCASPQTYSSLAEGAHSFEVRALDTAGNADGSPAEFGWTVDTTPPAVGIDSGPAGLTNDATPTFAFHAGEAGAAVECSIDTGTPDFGPCTEEGSETPEGPLSDGPHTFRVRSTDAAGNQATATRDFTLDATSPETTLGAHPPSLSGSDEASFEFTGSDPGGSGVASFQCRKDGGSWSGCASPQTYSSLAEGAHSFEVRALDNAGNADGSPAQFGWTVDTTPPAVGIDSGPAGLTNDATPTFAFHAGEAGAAVECSIDTGTPDFGPCTEEGSETPEGPLSDGPHTFRVRSTDAAGNQATATRDFEVDTSLPQAPELTATDPASPANDNQPKIEGSAPAGTTVKLFASTDCSGEPISVGSAAELEAGIAVLVPDDSTTAVRATATTAAGNVSGCSEPISYVEDSSAPQTTIDSHPASLTESPDAEFTFSGSDSGAGVSFYQCHIDGGSWSTCASPREYTGLSDGAHTFEARAADRAGNVDGSPASFTWAIDTSPAEPSQPSSSEPTQSSTESSQPPALALKVPPEQAELLRVLRRPKNGTALLLFKVPAPGTLSAQTPAISLGRTNRRRRTAERIRQLHLRQRRIKPLSIRVTHPGKAKVPIVLTPAGKRLLARTHRLKVRVVIRYSAAGGTKKATWKITVTLKKRVVRAVTKSRHKKRGSRK